MNRRDLIEDLESQRSLRAETNTESLVKWSL
jgi:hypothetical protein